MSRAALISSAVTFLRDPQTASSPLAQRIGFLESKGLTPQEIEQALSQANSSIPYSNNGMNQNMIGGGRGGNMMIRREYERDWRDWFIMAVVGGSVGYVAAKLAQKFVVPHLQPPSETELMEAQKALEAKYDEASSLLATLQISTDALSQSLDDQKLSVEKELDEVRKAVEEMREGEKRREEWSKKVGDQVDEVVRGLPGLLEKQASTSAQSLTDLQTELKSLKSLLIARRPAPASSVAVPAVNTSAPSSIPSINGSSSLPAATTPILSSSTSTVSTNVSESDNPTGSIRANSPFGIRKPGIPSWQRSGASSASLANAPNPTSASSSTSEATTKDSAVTKEEDGSASGVLVQKEDALGARAGEDAKGGETKEVGGNKVTMEENKE